MFDDDFSSNLFDDDFSSSSSIFDDLFNTSISDDTFDTTDYITDPAYSFMPCNIFYSDDD
jgi:hypothetical protein